MLKKILLLILICIGVSLSGCSGVRQLNPGAVDVNLVTNAPKACRFLGKIENLSVHSDLDIQTPLQELRNDAINFLKNEGVKQGANVIVLVRHESKALPPQYRQGISGLIIIYDHSISANAYWCSQKILHQLKQDELTNIKIEESPLFKQHLISEQK